VHGRAAVAEDRAFTTGEDHGHPPSLLTQVSVPDRIDPAVDAVEPARIDSAPDRVMGEPGSQELRR
jgi:hypothetical protein